MGNLQTGKKINFYIRENHDFHTNIKWTCVKDLFNSFINKGTNKMLQLTQRWIQTRHTWVFPGRPVVRTLGFNCRGARTAWAKTKTHTCTYRWSAMLKWNTKYLSISTGKSLVLYWTKFIYCRFSTIYRVCKIAQRQWKAQAPIESDNPEGSLDRAPNNLSCLFQSLSLRTIQAEALSRPCPLRQLGHNVSKPLIFQPSN